MPITIRQANSPHDGPLKPPARRAKATSLADETQLVLPLIMKLLAPQSTTEAAPEGASREFLEHILAPAFACAETSASLITSRHLARLRGRAYEIPKFLFLGQRGGGEPIRLALFAGFEPGQNETVTALTTLLLDLEAAPGGARDYALFGYPVVNLRGFDETPAPLSDFERRFAKDSADEDVQFFKVELRRWFFNGLITLRTDANSSGLYAAVRSEIIADQVIKPVSTWTDSPPSD